jgi:hypothetical protein
VTSEVASFNDHGRPGQPQAAPDSKLYLTPGTLFEIGNLQSHVYASMREPSGGFNGACIDSGAQKTVIGVVQARAYCVNLGVAFKPVPL